MKRFSLGVLLAGGLLALSACAPTSPPPEQAEVDAWNQAQHEAMTADPRALASMSGGAESVRADTEDGISVTFAQSRVVSDVEFSCFGAQAMTLSVWMSGESSSVGNAFEELRCADSPHVLADGLFTEAATRVTVDATAENESGVWSVIVHGDDEGSL